MTSQRLMAFLASRGLAAARLVTAVLVFPTEFENWGLAWCDCEECRQDGRQFSAVQEAEPMPKVYSFASLTEALEFILTQEIGASNTATITLPTEQGAVKGKP